MQMKENLRYLVIRTRIKCSAQLIGVVPQFDTFFNELTVKEHLALVARLHNVSKKDIPYMTKEIAEKVGLGHDAFQHTSALLSGGQKRRLTLGMALMSKPLLLFLDEPTVSGVIVM